MSEKILVVDDEREIADLLEVYLKNENYTVYKFYNGTDALKCVEETEIDLAILDIMLPDIDGFRICQKIREKFYFPVIMLTAKVEDGEKIMGLTIGADDYITLEEYVNFIKSYREDDRLLYSQEQNTAIEVYYVPALKSETTIIIPEQSAYQISGNNVDGFIITIRRKVNGQI